MGKVIVCDGNSAEREQLIDLVRQCLQGKEVQVTYDLDTISSYGNLSWHLRTEGKSAVINPVKHIRRLRAAQAVLREMGE